MLGRTLPGTTSIDPRACGARKGAPAGVPTNVTVNRSPRGCGMNNPGETSGFAAYDQSPRVRNKRFRGRVAAFCCTIDPRAGSASRSAIFTPIPARAGRTELPGAPCRRRATMDPRALPRVSPNTWHCKPNRLRSGLTISPRETGMNAIHSCASGPSGDRSPRVERAALRKGRRRCRSWNYSGPHCTRFRCRTDGLYGQCTATIIPAESGNHGGPSNRSIPACAG